MMMVGGRSSSSSSSCRHPFTAAQWQELEHQFLIFRYMASGMPVPSDLITPIRRSLLLQSMTSNPQMLAFPPPQPIIGWGFHMGLGRKEEDPEPGRCRRTDGKKWRCAKEASPDSKYCERHMHRGRSRSRRPVEAAASANSTTTPVPNSPHPYSSYPSPLSMYSHSSPSKPLALGLSIHDSTTDFQPVDKHYRQLQEVVDENSFSLKSHVKENDPNCFVLGADLKLDKALKGEEEGEQVQKPKNFLNFLDKGPKESKRSWLATDEDRSNLASHSRTQLSISIPMAHHDF